MYAGREVISYPLADGYLQLTSIRSEYAEKCFVVGVYEFAIFVVVLLLTDA